MKREFKFCGRGRGRAFDSLQVVLRYSRQLNEMGDRSTLLIVCHGERALSAMKDRVTNLMGSIPDWVSITNSNIVLEGAVPDHTMSLVTVKADVAEDVSFSVIASPTIEEESQYPLSELEYRREYLGEWKRDSEDETQQPTK